VEVETAADGIEALELLLSYVHAPEEIQALASSSVMLSPGSMSEEAQAWLRAVQWPFDVLLLDVGLPRKTGDIVATQLRALGCPLPLLSVTGSTTQEEIARLRAAGFDDVLAKPFGGHDLREALANVQAVAKGRAGAGAGAGRTGDG
jgi:CheY-like chemotaxis protein